jgi:hypothetical protein
MHRNSAEGDTPMNTRNHIPDTVSASLEARLAPFSNHGTRAGRAVLEDLDVEASRAVAPRQDRRLRSGLLNDLKLLFAALGAGGRVVPMGDNGRTARLLSEYANSLRWH